MNKTFFKLMMLSVALVATTAFASCGDDEPGDEPVGLKVVENSIEFNGQGGEHKVNVQSAVAVSATSSAQWCTVEVGTMSQNLKVTLITVKAEAMPDDLFADRTATISVSAGAEHATINVTQHVAARIELSENQFGVGPDATTVEVKVKATDRPTVAISANWLYEESVVGTQVNDKQYDGTHRYLIMGNDGPARTATITFTLPDGRTTATVSVSQEAAAVAPITATAMDVAKLMYPAWNLGNTLEPPVNSLNAETSWQSTKTTQQIIDYVKSLGFRAVRIPCSWNSHATNGQIDPQWTARVKEVVDYCISDGLYVMLNDHWDNGWIEVNGFNNLNESNVTSKIETLQSLWTQVASAFIDYDEHLLFAGLNEPNCDTQAKTDVLLRYEQAFIDAVRATGGNNANRILIVQGPSTDIDNTDNFYDISRLNDTAANALMAEVHYYSPWNFCGMEQDESWGKMFYYWGVDNHVSGNQRNANWGEESYLRTQFQKMKRKFVDRGFPVIIGEYGCQWRDVSNQSGEDQAKHDASVKLFHKLVNQYAVNYGMVPVVWDINYTNQGGTKGVMTIVNRSQLSIYCKPAMDGITEGVAAAAWLSN